MRVMRASAPRAGLAILAAVGLLVVGSAVADAKCTRLAFSVNDYGKEGPARDAKNLLDKYIQKWTAENGIKSYRVGKKDVTCELFIDLGFFDEYTCKASASVCWPDGAGGPKAAATGERSGSETREPGRKRAGSEPAASPAGQAKPAQAAAPKAPPAATTGSIPAPATAPAATAAPAAKKE